MYACGCMRAQKPLKMHFFLPWGAKGALTSQCAVFSTRGAWWRGTPLTWYVMQRKMPNHTCWALALLIYSQRRGLRVIEAFPLYVCVCMCMSCLLGLGPPDILAASYASSARNYVYIHTHVCVYVCIHTYADACMHMCRYMCARNHLLWRNSFRDSEHVCTHHHVITILMMHTQFEYKQNKKKLFPFAKDFKDVLLHWDFCF